MSSVLIVEDNADLRDMYAEILAMGEHTARGVETAAEAVAALREDRPHILLLDLGISGGIDPVIEAVKGEPPVNVILASGARDLVERANQLGAGHLQKPFGPEQLLEAVARAVAR